MATQQVIQATPSGSPNVEAIYKLPIGWRYFNISVLWIFYYRSAIHLLYRLRVRHELVTVLSILSGLAGGWLILQAETAIDFVAAAIFVHLKDLFDACDGALARMTGTGHRLGRFLDTLGDGAVFTGWIAACSYRVAAEGVSGVAALSWGVVAWLSLFLQCSYFNFHQLHYIRLAGAGLTSSLDERAFPARGAVAAMARLYDLWFGWQDRLVARFDRWQRSRLGFPREPSDPGNDRWYAGRPFMVANSALCFGTHAFVLILCLLIQSPFSFLPAVVLWMNTYWLAIVLARRVVFRRTA